MFGRLMNSFYYGKSGKGDYRKEDLPKNRWQLFWEMLRIRLSGLCRINLMTCIAWIPTMVVVAMLLNAVLTASDLVRVKDETTNSSVMMLVYDAPVDEDGTTVGWPDLAHVFTKAAIATKGAQIHPEVLGPELVERLSPYLRVTFSVEQQLPAGKHPRGRRHARGPIKVLGMSKDLKALQRKFAAQAEASARQMVKKQADQAGEQGKLVSQANLLHKAGATTESRATMLWRGALDALRLPAERISSRWLGTEALMLASAPYKSTKDLVEDLQLATVKRLMPNVDRLSDDEALANAVLDVREVYEDTVYQVAHDVIAVLKAYAEVDKATGGKADLPMLSVLQSIRDHIATLVYPGFIGRTPPDALKSLSRYLRADLSRLNKAKTDTYDMSKIHRDVPQFVCTTSFEQGIARTMAFYRTHPEFQLIDEEWNAQIDRLCEEYGG